MGFSKTGNTINLSLLFLNGAKYTLAFLSLYIINQTNLHAENCLSFSKEANINGIATIKTATKENLRWENPAKTTFKYLALTPDIPFCIDKYEPDPDNNNKIKNIELTPENITLHKNQKNIIGKHIQATGYLDASPYRNNPTLVRLHVIRWKVLSSH